MSMDRMAAISSSHPSRGLRRPEPFTLGRQGAYQLGADIHVYDIAAASDAIVPSPWYRTSSSPGKSGSAIRQNGSARFTFSDRRPGRDYCAWTSIRGAGAAGTVWVEATPDGRRGGATRVLGDGKKICLSDRRVS